MNAESNGLTTTLKCSLDIIHHRCVSRMFLGTLCGVTPTKLLGPAAWQPRWRDGGFRQHSGHSEEVFRFLGQAFFNGLMSTKEKPPVFSPAAAPQNAARSYSL